jgi:hypothetical protein
MPMLRFRRQDVRRFPMASKTNRTECHGLIAWVAFVCGNRLRFTALLQDLIQRCGTLLKSIGEQLNVPVMQ